MNSPEFLPLFPFIVKSNAYLARLAKLVIPDQLEEEVQELLELQEKVKLVIQVSQDEQDQPVSLVLLGEEAPE